MWPVVELAVAAKKAWMTTRKMTLSVALDGEKVLVVTRYSCSGPTWVGVVEVERDLPSRDCSPTTPVETPSFEWSDPW